MPLSPDALHHAVALLYLDRLTKRSYPQSPDGHAELLPISESASAG